MYQLTVSRSATQSVNKICSEMDALSIAFSRNEDCSKGKNHAELNFLFKNFDLFFDHRILGLIAHSANFGSIYSLEFCH